MGTVEHAISGLLTTPLRIIGDDRGAVLHMLRADAEHFDSFGEVYFSLVNSGAIKAWKRHRSMVQNFAVPLGSIRLIVYDDRPDSPTNGVVSEIITGVASGNYELVRLPPMVWYGFAGLDGCNSLIANCASIPHDPEEVERLPPDSSVIPYSWA